MLLGLNDCRRVRVRTSPFPALNSENTPANGRHAGRVFSTPRAALDIGGIAGIHFDAVVRVFDRHRRSSRLLARQHRATVYCNCRQAGESPRTQGERRCVSPRCSSMNRSASMAGTEMYRPPSRWTVRRKTPPVPALRHRRSGRPFRLLPPAGRPRGILRISFPRSRSPCPAGSHAGQTKTACRLRARLIHVDQFRVAGERTKLVSMSFAWSPPGVNSSLASSRHIEYQFTCTRKTFRLPNISLRCV